MLNRPLVSVYCLAYNHEKYIRDTLEGFVNQKTNFPFEVYVHDDASTDNTPSIIQEYAEKYSNIIKPIYQKENQYSQNISILRKFIAPKVRGKYIAICEGDDYWNDMNKLQLQVDFLEDNDEYTACVHNTIKIRTKYDFNKTFNNLGTDCDLTLEQIILKGGGYFHLSSLLYRSEYFINELPDFFSKISHAGDYTLSIYLALNGKIRYIDKVMSVYRVLVPGSWTDRTRRKSLDERVDFFYDKISMLKSVNDYSESKYADIIDNAIDKTLYDISVIRGDYKTIKNSARLNCIHKSQSLKYRILVFLKAHFKGAYNLYRTVKLLITK